MNSSTQIKPIKAFDELKKILNQLLKNPKAIKSLPLSDLIDCCLAASSSYRAGNPLIEDDFYDHFLIKELAEREPNHPLISEVEDDYQSFGSAKVNLPEPMLSTQKAYEIRQIELYLERIAKKATELSINFADIQFKLTAKLDGFAAYFDGKQLITRGNGTKGTDISRALVRGLVIHQKNQSAKAKPTGAGEIVVKKSYFYKYLVNDFIHPRNFVASVIKEKELDEKTAEAVKAKAALFMPFSELDAVYLKADDLISGLDEATNTLTQRIDFEFDGVVIEIAAIDDIHLHLREKLGQTLHHHRWQIAYKKNTESARSTIIDLIAQTGRTGKITPVALISPVKLSGARISRVSAHNYHLVEKLEIGKGAKVEIVRSGEVIPKITAIIKPAEKVLLPKKCPSCGSELVWQTKFLICPNHQNCPEQVQASLSYFFVSLDNLDGFGPVTVKIFYDSGIRKVSEIYQLNDDDLKQIGYKAKTRFNLLTALSESKLKPLEDWRFLSAFGVERLGTAASIKLMENFDLTELFDLKEEQISKLDGFAEKTAKAMMKGLKLAKNEFQALVGEFNLIKTKKITTASTSDRANQKLPLANLTICFSGKMQQDRDAIQNQARKLGARVVGSVSSATSLLIVGEKVGISKLEKAKKLNIKTLTEKEYQDYLAKELANET